MYAPVCVCVCVHIDKLLDDNRARQFHDMAKQCARKIIEAIIAKNDISLMVPLCAMLNEKMNIVKFILCVCVCVRVYAVND